MATHRVAIAAFKARHFSGTYAARAIHAKFVDASGECELVFRMPTLAILATLPPRVAATSYDASSLPSTEEASSVRYQATEYKAAQFTSE